MAPLNMLSRVGATTGSRGDGVGRSRRRRASGGGGAVAQRAAHLSRPAPAQRLESIEGVAKRLRRGRRLLAPAAPTGARAPRTLANAAACVVDDVHAAMMPRRWRRAGPAASQCLGLRREARVDALFEACRWPSAAANAPGPGAAPEEGRRP